MSGVQSYMWVNILLFIVYLFLPIKAAIHHRVEDIYLKFQVEILKNVGCEAFVPILYSF